MEIRKATKSGTYKTFLRIKLPRLIVPEKEAVTVVLLGNLICIGVIGDKDLKNFGWTNVISGTTVQNPRGRDVT